MLLNAWITKSDMLKKWLLVLVGVVLGCSGCQSTPNNEIVIEKNREKIETEIKEQNDLEVLDIPQTWQKYKVLDGSNTEIVINAEIVYPEEKLPVIQVTPHEITSDEVKKWADVLLQGHVPYEASNEMSKHELEEKILSLRKYIDNDLKDEYGFNNETYELVKSDMEKMIRVYEEKYNLAPDVINKKVTDWQFHPQYYYEAYVDLYNNSEEFYSLNKTECLYIQTAIDGIPYELQATNRNEQDFRIHSIYWGCSSYDGYSKQKQDNTDEQAVHLVESFLEQIGMEEWSLYECTSRAFKDMYWYDITFIPTYCNIPVLKQNQLDSVKNDDIYASNYYYESLNVQVSNGKIVSIMFVSPLDIVEVKNSDAKIIDFNSFQERCLEQLSIQYSELQFEEEKEVAKSIISVEKMELGLVRTRIPDNEEDFYLIPAWNIIGRIEYELEDGTKYSDGKTTLLTMSALDGSVINTELGY